MIENNTPNLSEFLSLAGWTIVNNSIMLNDELQTLIKIADGKLEYFLKGESQKEIPLEIVIHYDKLCQTRELYDKTLKLITALKNRHQDPYYNYGNYRWNDIDSFVEWAPFHLVRLHGDDSDIALENNGFIQIYSGFKTGAINEGLYQDNDVIKEIIIELGLSLNPGFYYNRYKDKFDITEEDKSKFVASNREYLSNY